MPTSGFPRSIRGLQILMTVVEDRQAQRVFEDEVGPEATPPAVKEKISMKKAKQVLEELTGQTQDGPTGVSAKKWLCCFQSHH